MFGWRGFAGIVAGAVALGLVTTARADAPLKLRVAWTETPTHLLPVAFSRPEILKHYGKTYTVEAIRFRGSAPEIQALAAGELDIATLGYSSFGLAILNAGMNDIRVIADGHRDGVPGYQTGPYLVLADGPIHRVEDLKGKVLGTNGIGGAAYFAMIKEMHDRGFEEKRDYQVVEVAFPNMLAALDAKKIDLGPTAQPVTGIAERRGGYRSLFTIRDAMGGETQMTLMSARAAFIAVHRAALVDFFEDFQRATRWFTDPKNRAAAIAILSDFTKRPPDDFADWLFTKDDSYHDPDAKPNLAALQRNLDDLHRLGVLKEAVDVKSHADLSPVEEAAQRLATVKEP
ncbi:MAG TPA: ABC transporter substrate-binding protein [Stellaceae bacterium]|nr:ABC transporter substrate-binding protein [Stellaceae bacterium]